MCSCMCEHAGQDYCTFSTVLVVSVCVCLFIHKWSLQWKDFCGPVKRWEVHTHNKWCLPPSVMSKSLCLLHSIWEENSCQLFDSSSSLVFFFSGSVLMIFYMAPSNCTDSSAAERILLGRHLHNLWPLRLNIWIIVSTPFSPQNIVRHSCSICVKQWTMKF